MTVGVSPDGDLERITWEAIPIPTDHALIDRIGTISGEAVTLFTWDEAEGDFVRVTTNVLKPDGTRAVGTPIGLDNPARAAVLRGETYIGEAQILGKPYDTIYEPVF